jgi:hypothetical protein
VEGRERPACDWIAQRLTGKDRLSSSDAISNGLLDQQTKKLAESTLRKGKLNPKWFPKVVQSGRNVGRGPRPVSAPHGVQQTLRPGGRHFSIIFFAPADFNDQAAQPRAQ